MAMATRTEEPLAGFPGIYEISEAARYLRADIRIPEVHYRVQSTHLIRWIRSGLAHPALAVVPGRELLITFEDLISMRVIAFLRAQGYSFKKIRQAELMLRNLTRHPRPFATSHIWAEEEGALDIFAEIGALLLTASRSGQVAFKELVKQNLIDVHGLTFDQLKVADSWTPRQGIKLHPRIQFGRSCISGTRIPTQDIAGMVAAGDKIQFLAMSYGISEQQIMNAVNWEKELAATRPTN
ncbi:MAG: DUF433 domain-containing protein [Chloroflexi bacterium]|nr:DUF433 domain-containing protein [Chloroflexota bacterium]